MCANTTDCCSEAEIQALIAHLELAQPIETPNNIDYPFYPQNLAQAEGYFRRTLLDWSAAYPRLVAQGLLTQHDGAYALTADGMRAAAPRSPADLLLVYRFIPSDSAQPGPRDVV